MGKYILLGIKPLMSKFVGCFIVPLSHTLSMPLHISGSGVELFSTTKKVNSSIRFADGHQNPKVVIRL